MKRQLDLTGQTFGKLVVLRKDTNRKTKGTYWVCQCQCSAKTETSVFSGSLRAGKTKSCGCRQGVREDSPFRHLKYRYMLGAKERGLIYTLSDTEFSTFISQNCYYCNLPPSKNVAVNCPGYPEFRYNGIDRMDSSIGYTTDNCVPCCHYCNWIKYDTPQNEFITQVCRIHTYTRVEMDPTVSTERWATYLELFHRYQQEIPDVRRKPEAPCNFITAIYKVSARRRRGGIKFALTQSEVISLLQSDCYYCGSEPTNTLTKYPLFLWNGIDRVDNHRGYIYGNVVPACSACNHIKSDLTKTEFMERIRAIHSFQSQRGHVCCGEPRQSPDMENILTQLILKNRKPKQRNPAFINMVGMTVNGIEVLREGNKINGDTLWECRCHCGGLFVTRGAFLRKGHTRSCGCRMVRKTLLELSVR
jgi:hypothetical protein